MARARARAAPFDDLPGGFEGQHFGISLFAGAGGIDLGLRLLFGEAYRTVCYVEREAYAAATLAARMEDGGLDPAPVWDDVRSFDGRPWRGVVDIISGGFPCQDISNAGLRAGIEGKKSGLWSEYARILDEVRPRLVFVENVRALVVRGLGRVLGDLAELGYDAEWIPLRASEVGAPHARERLFLLAWPLSDPDRGGIRERAEWDQRRPAERGDAEPIELGAGDVGGPSRSGVGLADAGREPLDAGRAADPGEAQGRESFGRIAGRGPCMDDASSSGRGEGRPLLDGRDRRPAPPDASGGAEHATQPRLEDGREGLPLDGRKPVADRDRGRLGVEREPGRGGASGGDLDGPRRAPWPPGPDDRAGWSSYLAEWPGLEPAIRGGADGVADRVDRLRLTGNGVVPQQFARAFREILKRAGVTL